MSVTLNQKTKDKLGWRCAVPLVKRTTQFIEIEYKQRKLYE
ncbi:hypothetical protein IKE_05885 [Bacillus cereus VD196]|uniref:Uncharacterized protein n=1 Tax=Bacillus cereus VD196 TaxID=1053243 RepID=A0A9W5PYH7_BACCE|nr:hypothetical protein IKG_05510 [Bacillus cereus VD200]EOO61611.1 hypothetical protein IKE_05885 [Bacillus cereus VD196]